MGLARQVFKGNRRRCFGCDNARYSQGRFPVVYHHRPCVQAVRHRFEAAVLFVARDKSAQGRIHRGSRCAGAQEAGSGLGLQTENTRTKGEQKRGESFCRVHGAKIPQIRDSPTRGL